MPSDRRASISTAGKRLYTIRAPRRNSKFPPSCAGRPIKPLTEKSLDRAALPPPPASALQRDGAGFDFLVPDVFDQSRKLRLRKAEERHSTKTFTASYRRE
jgi:hypothetical protein